MNRLLAFIYDRRARDIFWQVTVLVSVFALLGFFVKNASDNMVKAGIASGFEFLGRTAGLEIPFVLTSYTTQSTILALMWVGVVNTLIITAISAIIATTLGFVVGIARLSNNWLLSNLAGAYVETIRNIPLLFFILFWYFGVIAALPGPREAINLFAVAFLSNRGLTIPIPQSGSTMMIAAAISMAMIALQIGLAVWATRRRHSTGRSFPIWGVGAVLTVGVPIAAFGIAAIATPWDIPAFRGFNFRGGFVLIPEFVALVAALSTYTAAFVAEIVRGGILAVPKGQIEAARAIGLTPIQVLRLVTIPQALRVIIPPMTSQYLNVLKNSSLGAAIAFPELVNVFMGSALNLTGQAVEIIAITLAVYLSIGLAVSALMNWYNAKMALVTR
ncbi:MAG TPA: ABC transporter permease subunit [Xanthobacteraceae bacterium]|jgi:general L-amino acid transport system permease protein|nr:ABC transporter permease subunit [Xanthobacteraceae bacterium]